MNEEILAAARNMDAARLSARGEGRPNVALLLILALWGPTLAYLFLQVYAPFRLRRGWRWAALLPVLPMLLVLGDTVYWTWHDSNLAWMLVVLSAPVALLYEVMVLAAHGASVRRANLRVASTSPRETPGSTA
jgi:hypothetical protein